MSEELKVINNNEINQVQLSPVQIMQQAKAAGLEISEMKEMLALQKDYEANEARKAFHHALAEFKMHPPKIIKDLMNAQYNSSYVSIGNMVNSVNEAMGPHGLNARWDYPQTEGNQLAVTCILAHRLGHEESVSITGPIDDAGKKNPLQGRKSTRTYLKLETFEAVTGMASVVGNIDDDGNREEKPIEICSTDQITVLRDLIKEVNADGVNFLKYLKVDDLDYLPAVKYEKAKAALEAKR